MKIEHLLLSTAYLAPVSYYAAMFSAKNIYLEQWENYQKQSYRNRCCIAAANGVMDMSIPVERVGKEKILTKDVRISEHDEWQRQHWKSIVSAYNTTPFFEYYQDDFAPFYHTKWKFLLDFNLALQAKVLELLQIKKKMILTTEYQLANIAVLDLREAIHPKKDYVFDAAKYYQVFENKFGFLPNLSIIDLLFNMGNESVLYLAQKK